MKDDWLLGIFDRIYFLSVVIAALATASSIIASLFQYQLNQRIGNQKDQSFNHYQQQTAANIAIANTSADVARNDAAQANLAAKEAEAKTAVLEKEAAEARLETMRIRQQLAWRSLSTEQVEKFSDFCANRLRHIDIMLSVQSDPETAAFAEQIFQTMKSAEVLVTPGAAYMDQPFVGSKLRGPPTSARLLVLQAMNVIGLTPTIEDGARIEMIIGLKTPPKL